MNEILIKEELKRREAIAQVIDIAFNKIFDIADKAHSIRRNDVNLALLKTMGMEKSLGAWRLHKLMFERLQARGIVKGKTDGKRYFRGLKWKTSSTTL